MARAELRLDGADASMHRRCRSTCALTQPCCRKTRACELRPLLLSSRVRTLAYASDNGGVWASESEEMQPEYGPSQVKSPARNDVVVSPEVQGTKRFRPRVSKAEQLCICCSGPTLAAG